MPLWSERWTGKTYDQRTNQLFDLQDKIILYDLANTYFEGAVRSSKAVKFGWSK